MLGRGDQVFEVEFEGQGDAYFIVQVGQDPAGAFRFDHAPYAQALHRRQRLEQAGDFGRVHAVQNFPHALELFQAQGLADGFQVVEAAQTCLLGGLGPGLGSIRRIANQLANQPDIEVRQDAPLKRGVDLLPQRQAGLGFEQLQHGGDLGRVHMA